MRCPKKSSRCSLARFFRPLRVLRLAASATGGARLRTPYPSPDAGEGDSIYNLYIKMRRRHLESVSAAPYGSTFLLPLKSPIRIQPQLSGKGVLGRSPKRVLPTFARTKVGPRRVGVLALHPTKSPRRRRRLPIWLKNTFAPFLHRKGGPRRRAVQTLYPTKSSPRRQATTNPPQNIIMNPSKLSPNKSTSYINLTQQSPIL